ncbi:MAG: hypothetical protein LBM62_05275 [Mediterranea sp.]|jgi:predicted helicase|nr:hypothetical protein [Mediterranea sp.]
MNFNTLLDIYRKEAQSEREKGARFERLMQRYLLTEPYYASHFSKVWLWDEFPFRKNLGGSDTGIDLVANTGSYWAVQCKCYQETTTINKDNCIVDDPNDWAREHNQPRYILDLLRSVIAISVKTVEIVKNLPKVKFE